MTSDSSKNRSYALPQLFEIGRAVDILQRQPDGANKDRSAFQRVQGARSSKAKGTKTSTSTTKDKTTKDETVKQPK
jgi:hypothetical protein